MKLLSWIWLTFICFPN